MPRALRKTDVENEVEKNEARTTKACGQQMSCEIPKIKKKESIPALSKQLHNNKDTSNVKVTKIDDSDIHKILNVDNALSLESGNNSVVKRTKACVSGENLNDHEQCMKVFNPRHTEIESESNENNSNSKAACMTTNEVCNEENLCKTKIEDEPSSENPEDSWETMFNDEGDCLDPKFIKEVCYFIYFNMIFQIQSGVGKTTC